MLFFCCSLERTRLHKCARQMSENCLVEARLMYVTAVAETKSLRKTLGYLPLRLSFFRVSRFVTVETLAV